MFRKLSLEECKYDIGSLSWAPILSTNSKRLKFCRSSLETTDWSIFNTPTPSIIHSKLNECCSYSPPTPNDVEKATGTVHHQLHYKRQVDRLEQVRRHQVINESVEVKRM